MPVELETVDRLLHHPSFFEPFQAYFHAALGRPSVLIETLLRLMFLKFPQSPGLRAQIDGIEGGRTWECGSPRSLDGLAPGPAAALRLVPHRLSVRLASS